MNYTTPVYFKVVKTNILATTTILLYERFFQSLFLNELKRGSRGLTLFKYLFPVSPAGNALAYQIIYSYLFNIRLNPPAIGVVASMAIAPGGRRGAFA